MSKICIAILILVILIAPMSLAHSGSVYYTATLICTEHRNELAARGLGPIFMHKDKYCVAFADSSQQILKEFADWIYTSIFEVFTGTVANNSVINHNRDRQNTTFLDELIDWVTGENFSGDTERYAGNTEVMPEATELEDSSAGNDKNNPSIPIAQ